MMDQICAHIHNYFTDAQDIRAGEYEIAGGTLELPFLMEGQYFRIVGSAMNDGVYAYPAEDLTDETFTGEIWAMKVPAGLRKLAAEIEAWQEKYGAAVSGPYQSESFAGYSYQRSAAIDAAGAGGAAWQTVFKSRLNEWRKLS